jgi:dolichol-phosphate mannosyltransferase
VNADALGQVLVIVPTYNERENLEPIVARVRAATPEAHLLIADDGSPDGTGEIADSLAASDPNVHVLHRRAKEGLGAAYLAGFGWGLEHGYDVLVEMDADGSHQPEQLPALLHALEGADLVIGSRWIAGGTVRNWPWRREVLSRGANTYTRLAMGSPVRDMTGGFRAFRADALRSLELQNVSSQGYCFQVDLAWRALLRGLRVVEVPITFVERERGNSKMSGAIVREALVNVTAWGLAHRGRQLARLVRRPGAGQRATEPHRP